MLKFYKILVLLILLAGSRQLISQSTLLNPITTLIDKSKAGNKLPTIIDNAGNTRGAGFNGENIFVATRTGGNIIYYWDVAKPDDDPKTMNTSIITGGAFPLSDLTAVGKKVFASNMVNATGSLFKMYGWANKDAQPKVLLEFAAPASTRLGDAFSVVGDPATDGLLIASGHGTKSFYIWKMKGDTISDKTPNIVTLDSVMNVNFARITKVPQSDMYLASGSSMGMALLDKDFKVLEWIKPGVYFPSWPMYAQVVFYKGKRLLAYQHVKTSPVENFSYVLDISSDSTTLSAFKNIGAKPAVDRIIHSASIGNVSNGNASVSVDILPDDAGNLLTLSYSAGNGFILQQYGNVVKPSIKPVSTIIDKSKFSNKLPAIIDNSSNTRGAGFNGENVFVATRTGGNIIYYWDVAKPDDDPKTMNTSIITGGAFPLSDLTAVGKKVFASNMVNATGSLFKMYGWANKDAQPKVLLEFAAPASTRLGDAFSVVGDPATDGLLIASGHGTKSFYIWKMKGDTISDKTPNIVTLDSVMNVNFARITKVPQSDMYLASGPTMGMALLDKDFKVLEWIKPGVYFPSWAMYAQVFTYKNQILLGYVHTKSSPVENFLYVVDITTGANIRDALKDLIATPFADRLIHSVNLGNVSNGNASVGLSILPDALGNVWAMAYGAGNGFVLQRFGDKISSAWDYNVSAFKMYPNPSSGILNIDSEYRIKKVVVFDINGRMIDAMPSDSQQITLDVSGFQNGVYFVSLQTDGGLFSKKLIIQK
jgi:phage FluMu protein gp41